MKIPIYKHEKDLADLISNSNSIAYTTECLVSQPNESDILNATALVTKANANQNQIDLFYMDAILASVGWNENDDVFDPIETWNAKDTPVDKPFNMQHIEGNNIGHITSSVVLGQDGKRILTQEDLPELFDIVVGSVIYRYYNNEDKQKQINKLIAEIENNEWFVSMECLFPNFDYAVIDKDNTHKTIARNNDTSFLTKHLRIYGGKGEYNGLKLGRLLRNFVFSGKGLVRNPANPRSVIFVNKYPFNEAKSITLKTLANKEVTMDPQVEKLEADLKEARNEITRLLAEAQKEATQTFTKQISELEAKNEALKGDVEGHVSLLATKDEAIVALEKEVATKSAELVNVQNQLSDMFVQAKKTNRVTQLVNVGVEQGRATELVDKFIDTKDEVFAEIVTMNTKAQVETVVTDKTDEIVDNLETVDSSAASLAVDDEDKNKLLHTAASNWVGSLLHLTKK